MFFCLFWRRRQFWLFLGLNSSQSGSKFYSVRYFICWVVLARFGNLELSSGGEILGVDLFYVPSNLQTLTDVWSSIISGAISELRLPSFHTLLQLFRIFYIDSMLFPVEFMIVTTVTPKNLFMKVINLVLLLFSDNFFMSNHGFRIGSWICIQEQNISRQCLWSQYWALRDSMCDFCRVWIDIVHVYMWTTSELFPSHRIAPFFSIAAYGWLCQRLYSDH